MFEGSAGHVPRAPARAERWAVGAAGQPRIPRGLAAPGHASSRRNGLGQPGMERADDATC